MTENDDSVNVAKCVVFHWKYLKYTQNQWIGERSKIWAFPRKCEELWKRCRSTKKGALPECLYFHVFLKKIRCWCSKTKRGNSKNAYKYYRFWRILMIWKVGRRWRTFSFWVWRPPQQDFEAPAMRDQNDALSNFEYGRGYSKIMRSKRGRKNRDFERHCSLAERYRCRRWREKLPDPDGLVG